MILLLCVYMNEGLKATNPDTAPKANSPDTRKLSAHLIEGVGPIMVCIGSFDDFKRVEQEHPEHSQQMSNNFALHGLKNVDWFKGAYGFLQEDFLTNGHETYVISAIDDSNKFSLKFSSCIGLIIAGIDKITGKNISFVVHRRALPGDLEFNFRIDLAITLNNMKQRCK